MTQDFIELENRLNSFSVQERKAALDEAASVSLQASDSTKGWFNLHCHSFYSYNGYGMSPSMIVWTAKKLGLSMVGLVDFDVLDGVDEFHNAGRMLGVKTVAGMETRAFIEPFSTRVINSPGEPGVSYHMGCGFVRSEIRGDEAKAFASRIREDVAKRNLGVIERVNRVLDPVQLDYENDVLPLTPAGSPTERHICAAYDKKTRDSFDDKDKLAAFWAEKLGKPSGDILKILDDSAMLQGLIRSKTMKMGGAGYVAPTRDTFPLYTEVDVFTLSQGGIPTFAFLDGTSDGEQCMEELLDLLQEDGVSMVSIVPDRNWNIKDPEIRKVKLEKLYRFVKLVDSRHLPILIGTEMNAPGLKLVDTLDAPELQPVLESFKRGADILYGHSLKASQDGQGYMSDWAKAEFDSTADKNRWFENFGKTGSPPA